MVASNYHCMMIEARCMTVGYYDFQIIIVVTICRRFAAMKELIAECDSLIDDMKVMVVMMMTVMLIVILHRIITCKYVCIIYPPTQSHSKRGLQDIYERSDVMLACYPGEGAAS